MARSRAKRARCLSCNNLREPGDTLSAGGLCNTCSAVELIISLCGGKVIGQFIRLPSGDELPVSSDRAIQLMVRGKMGHHPRTDNGAENAVIAFPETG